MTGTENCIIRAAIQALRIQMEELQQAIDKLAARIARLEEDRRC